MNQNFNYLNKKNTPWFKVKVFFLPLYPNSIFKQTRLLVILSVLFALRFALQYATIHIPIVSVSFSLSWTPLMIIGWMFGPIVGFFCGIITDTISYLIKPTSIWFWMYAMQEPLVGLISGIIGSLYLLRVRYRLFDLNNTNIKYIKWDLIINQLIVIVFTTISVLIVLFWVNDTNSFEGKSQFDNFFFEYSKYIVIGTNIFFLLVVEILVIYFYIKHKKKFVLFTWILNLTIICSVIFSFLLGPISASEYYKYIYNKESPNVIKYGLIFYLIPRVIKESVKLPLQNVALLLLIPLTAMYVNNVKKSLRFSWKKP